MTDPFPAIEFEGMVLGRHLAPANRQDGGDRLERSAYTLLTRLEVEGPMSIPQLSEAFGLDVSTLNRQTAGILRAGFARRIADPAGGIARKFEITESGRRQLEAERETKLEGLHQILAGWSEDEVRDLARTLRRFNTAIEARDNRPWPRPGS